MVNEEFLERRKEVQNGFKVHLEYEYLLNTDIDWIIEEIRYAIREEIKSRKKEDKIFHLTLDVSNIQTGNSVDFWIYLGTVVAPELFRMYGDRIMDVIVDAAWERLRNKGISKKRRTHIRNGRVLKIRGQPGGQVEMVFAEGDEILIEE